MSGHPHPQAVQQDHYDDGYNGHGQGHGDSYYQDQHGGAYYDQYDYPQGQHQQGDGYYDRA